jgi:hypothetical protein
MAWTIAGSLGSHSEPGVDGNGWLWEITRDGDARRVFVEISGTAQWVSNAPPDTAEALRTEGQSEVERVLQMDSPPRIIKCGTTGCRDVFPEDLPQ